MSSIKQVGLCHLLIQNRYGLVSTRTTNDGFPSTSSLFPNLTASLRSCCDGLFGQVVLVSAVVLVFTAAAATGQNVLVNGDFESYPQISMANNIPGIVTPWVVGSGQQPNVVKVLANGSYHYMAGPWRDASTVGGSGPRHYLDIANGHNDIYQSFTPQCDGEVDFGGWFSSRSANDGTAYAGTGSLRIVQGVGTGGTLVGTTSTVSLPAGGNAHTDPWKLVNSTVNVVGGQTYSFVVTMDDNVNFDEAYVAYRIRCSHTATPTPTATVAPTPTPTPTDPCCPPWNATVLASMLVQDLSGGINDPYTIHFVPSAAFNNQMQAYINYVYSTNSMANKISMDWRLHDQGTGTTCTNCMPPYGQQVGPTVYTTWTQGGNGTPTFTNPGFFNLPGLYPMVKGHCYMIHTGLYLEGGQHFFPDSCSIAEVCFQWQVSARSSEASVLEIRAGNKVIRRIRINQDKPH